MVGEVHDHGQADEHQHSAPETASRGKSSRPGAPRHADGVQAGRGVHEGRDERAEHDLVGSIAQEVAKQAGRELGRRQLQRDHGQTQHQGDHGHHRAGDVDHQPAGVVGGALERQRGKDRIRPDVEVRHPEPDHQRRQGADPRQHPQRAGHILAQRFSTDHRLLLTGRLGHHTTKSGHVPTRPRRSIPTSTGSDERGGQRPAHDRATVERRDHEALAVDRSGPGCGRAGEHGRPDARRSSATRQFGRRHPTA